MFIVKKNVGINHHWAAGVEGGVLASEKLLPLIKCEAFGGVGGRASDGNRRHGDGSRAREILMRSPSTSTGLERLDRSTSSAQMVFIKKCNERENAVVHTGLYSSIFVAYLRVVASKNQLRKTRSRKHAWACFTIFMPFHLSPTSKHAIKNHSFCD